MKDWILFRIWNTKVGVWVSQLEYCGTLVCEPHMKNHYITKGEILLIAWRQHREAEFRHCYVLENGAEIYIFLDLPSIYWEKKSALYSPLPPNITSLHMFPDFYSQLKNSLSFHQHIFDYWQLHYLRSCTLSSRTWDLVYWTALNNLESVYSRVGQRWVRNMSSGRTKMSFTKNLSIDPK